MTVFLTTASGGPPDDDGAPSGGLARLERGLQREGLLVAFFLAGLVFLGGLQSWWLQPLLTQMSPTTVYYGATALTAITDNAALTYLASLVEGLSPEFKYAVVAGAVTGGGLTVIANAPNPAGQSILTKYFRNGISPLGLFLGALIPTIIMYLCFVLLPNGSAKEHPADVPPAQEQVVPNP